MNEKMRSSVMGLLLGQFSSPLPMAQKEPIAYLYNGIQLPPMPEWDKVKYPYAVIRKDLADQYFVEFTDKLYVYDGDNRNFWCYAPVKLKGYKWQDNQYYTDWKFELESEYTGVKHTAYYIFWTNTDILNEDGSVYLSASEPIPVYE